MITPLFLSSYNKRKNLRAIFEENAENAWLYLCVADDNKNTSSDVIGDVFICNTVRLIDHNELERYKPNLPPITTNFGTPEAVCINISEINWELVWLEDTSILLKKDQEPWALISLEDKRGMCKAIKKSGPWGNEWNEGKYKKAETP